MKKSGVIVSIILLSLFAFLASGFDEVTFSATPLNYRASGTHTVNFTNSASYDTTFNITLPAGWTFVSGEGCFNNGGTIECNATSGISNQFVVTSPAGDSEYTTTSFLPTFNDGNSSTNNVTFLNIEEYELFHTLVEFGRGRGNYFFDSGYTNKSGSGHTGIGCPYVPNGTLFELNYLHKVLNVKQYYGLADATAVNATFTCTYPNSTIVRTHLPTDINAQGDLYTISYLINEIEGSWERMGYVGQQYDEGEYDVGDQLIVNCTNITYYLGEVGGYMSVPFDNFSLEIRDRHPFTVNATSLSGTIFNGTSEIIVRYNITNEEIYTVDSAIIEIDAPEFGQFVGTRSELWGAALDTYRFETINLGPGESEILDLVVRFDTSNVASINSTQLADEVNVNYITCWEANAYNPSEYTQNLQGDAFGNATVDMTMGTNITDINNILEQILNNTINIQNTVNNINNLVISINETVFGNNTLQDILDAVNNITVDNSNLLNEIQQLQEFDEELVFLVTDAFGLAQEAGSAAEVGDRDNAVSKLQQANAQLAQAANRLEVIQNQAQLQQTSTFTLSDNRWLLPAALIVLGIGLYLYLFAEVPDKRRGPPPRRFNRPRYRR